MTIRYYEQIGLMPSPARTLGNYRSYGEAARARLQFICRCRELGFTLDQIRDLLRFSSQKRQGCEEVCRIADEHLDAVQKKLNDLQRLLNELQRQLPGEERHRRLPHHRNPVDLTTLLTLPARGSNSADAHLSRKDFHAGDPALSLQTASCRFNAVSIA